MKLLKYVFPLCIAAIPVTALADDHYVFKAKLRGANEIPTPVETDTRGRAKFEVDTYAGEIEFAMRIRHAVGIFGGPGAHIHCGFAEENGPIVAFLAGGMSQGLNGKVVVRGTLTNDNIASTACGSNIDEVLQSMLDGRTYVNVHSNRNLPGEIRGQIQSVGDDD